MRVYLLLLAPLLAQALPSPQGADVTGDELLAKSGTGGYTNDPTKIDSGLLGEILGGNPAVQAVHGNPINENYKPPKPENVKVDTSKGVGLDSCAAYKEDGYECTPYYRCDDLGEIITDGGPGLIDLRGNFGVEVEIDPDNSKCPIDIDVCCRRPEYVGEPIKPKVIPYKSICGTRNVGGIGVRIQNDRYQANTQFGEFPNMCVILEEKLIKGEKKNLFVAGASLIAPDTVLTTAHNVL